MILLKKIVDKYYKRGGKSNTVITMKQLIWYLDNTIRDEFNHIEPGLADKPIDLIQSLVKNHGGLGRVTEGKGDRRWKHLKKSSQVWKMK